LSNNCFNLHKGVKHDGVWFLFLQERKIQNTSHSSFLFSTLFKLHQIKENSSKEQKKTYLSPQKKNREALLASLIR
jgi:hypothetical protein